MRDRPSHTYYSPCSHGSERPGLPAALTERSWPGLDNLGSGTPLHPARLHRSSDIPHQRKIHSASISIKIQNAIVAAQDGGLDWKKKLSTHAVNATIATNTTDFMMNCKKTNIIGNPSL